MKKILLCMLLMIGIVGCGTDSSKTDSIIKLDEKGKGDVHALTLEEMNNKIENEESFIVVFTQTTCGYCIEFFQESQDYIKELGLPLWDVVLDEEPRDAQENLDMIHEHFPSFSATPSIYYVENGKLKDSLEADKERVDKEQFETFLKENEIIK